MKVCGICGPDWQVQPPNEFANVVHSVVTPLTISISPLVGPLPDQVGVASVELPAGSERMTTGSVL